MQETNIKIDKEMITENNSSSETNHIIRPEDAAGSLFRWTDESAEWYEKASAFTGYHDRLTELIVPHLSPEFNCCELACGTGTLARHLAPHVSSYVANDVDTHATAHLAAILKENDIKNIELAPGDWHKVFAGKSFNAVIFSFFGAVIQDWEELKKIVTDRIVVISPRNHKGKFKVTTEADENKEPQSDEEVLRPQRIVRGKIRSFETGPSICSFLDEEGVSYENTDIDLEFGQPFDNLSQARDYVRYYYNLKEKDIDFFLEKKLIRTDNGKWFMPKLKKLSVIIININDKN